MKYAGTRWFKTVHPMTYLFVLQSVSWGMMLIIELMFTFSNVMDVTYMFWPILAAYVWSILAIIAGVLLLWFLYRDCENRARERIWNTAKANLAIWVFATILWFIFGEWTLLIVSVINILGFLYIGMADRFPGKTLRV